MEGKMERILIIGATGYIGKRLVKASIALGHRTFLLYRPEIESDRDKVQMIIAFKMQGATLLQGSLDDQESLIRALKQVDIVISAVGGSHLALLQQLNLVDAIKQVGSIKRFLPSEFGMDVDRMEHAIPPGDEILTDKRVIRRAVEKAQIPYTFVSANCFAGIFLAGLAQLARFMPPTDDVVIYGNGDKKCIWIDEDDVARYTIMAVGDPRTLNKTLYLRPQGNILTQVQVVEIWEIIGKKLKKTFVSEEDWLANMDKVGPYDQIAVAHLSQIFHRGDMDFNVEGPHGVDSNDLYPDYRHMTAGEYLQRFA